MVANPLLACEFARLGRSGPFYAFRSVLPGILFAHVAYLLFFAALIDFPESELASWVQNGLTRYVGLLQFATVLILMPFLVITTLVADRAEANLDLLRLTSLDAPSLFFGKWLPPVSQGLLLLLCTLPVMALPAIMGGIDVSAELLRLLLLSVCGVATAGIAFLCATFTARLADAMIIALATIALVIGLGEGLDWLTGLAPTPYTFNTVGFLWQEFAPRWSGLHWAPGLVLYILVAAMAVGWSLARVSQLADVELIGRVRPKRSLEGVNLPDNTVAVRAFCRSRVGGVLNTRSRSLAVLAMAGFVALVFLPSIGPTVARLTTLAFLAFGLAAACHRARTEGLFLELSLTPYSTQQLGQAFLGGLARSAALFLVPLLLVALVPTIRWWIASPPATTRGLPWSFYVMYTTYIPAYALIYFLTTIRLAAFLSQRIRHPLQLVAGLGMTLFCLELLAHAGSFAATQFPSSLVVLYLLGHFAVASWHGFFAYRVWQSSARVFRTLLAHVLLGALVVTPIMGLGWLTQFNYYGAIILLLWFPGAVARDMFVGSFRTRSVHLGFEK
jgi:hypothetical protein